MDAFQDIMSALAVPKRYFPNKHRVMRFPVPRVQQPEGVFIRIHARSIFTGYT